MSLLQDVMYKTSMIRVRYFARTQITAASFRFGNSSEKLFLLPIRRTALDGFAFFTYLLRVGPVNRDERQ